MAGEHWFRMYHGAPYHPKWRVVAGIAAKSVTQCDAIRVCDVWLVATALMDRASQCVTERGRCFDAARNPVASHSSRDAGDRHRVTLEIASAFELNQTLVGAIIFALEEHRVIVDGRFRNWLKHQPKREDSSRERTQRYRAKRHTASPSGAARKKPNVTRGDARGEESKTQSPSSTSESSSAESNPEQRTRATRARKGGSGPLPPPTPLFNDSNHTTGKPNGLAEPSPRELKRETEQAFEQFWEMFPNQVGKGAARKAFPAAFKKAGGWLAIREGLRRYIETKPADIAWCNPTTFLNQERWLDRRAGGSNDGQQRIPRSPPPPIDD